MRDKDKMLCKLQKNLYALKQAPRQWYKKFESFMSSSGFLRCQADHCFYVKSLGNSFTILLLYVDDMLIAGGCKQDIDKLKRELSDDFEMKDLSAANQILGMRITRSSGFIGLLQEVYVKKVLSKFSMSNAKPVSTPLASHFKLSKDQLLQSRNETTWPKCLMLSL